MSRDGRPDPSSVALMSELSLKDGYEVARPPWRHSRQRMLWERQEST